MTSTANPRCHCGEPFVRYEGESSTCVGWLAGDNGCSHDPNCVRRDYHCAVGHRTTLSRRNSCHCGWKQNLTCFCHEGTKLEEWPRNIEGPRFRAGAHSQLEPIRQTIVFTPRGLSRDATRIYPLEPPRITITVRSLRKKKEDP